jgi:hypothetical protein
VAESTINIRKNRCKLNLGSGAFSEHLFMEESKPESTFGMILHVFDIIVEVFFRAI